MKNYIIYVLSKSPVVSVYQLGIAVILLSHTKFNLLAMASLILMGLIKMTSSLTTFLKKTYQNADFLHHFRIFPYCHYNLSVEFLNQKKKTPKNKNTSSIQYSNQIKNKSLVIKNKKLVSYGQDNRSDKINVSRALLRKIVEIIHGRTHHHLLTMW